MDILQPAISLGFCGSNRKQRARSICLTTSTKQKNIVSTRNIKLSIALSNFPLSKSLGFYSETGRDTKETFKLRRVRQYLDTRDPVAGWSIVSSL